MKITECSINNFGRLSSVKYDFSAGLNTHLADNGQGKSTLAAFICAMFYGLSDTKKTSLDENERKKYFPWNGGSFGGSLTFSTDKGAYRIERCFGKKASDDTFILYDAKSGRVSGDFTERLGEELFGIDADGFLRTVFLSEKNISEKNENKTISAKLSGVTGISADMGELDRALEILEDKRKLYHKKGGAGIITDTRTKAAELDAEITRLCQKEASLAKDEEELRKTCAALDAARAEKEHFEAARVKLEGERRVKTYKDQYDNMRRALGIAEEKYKKLIKFFENGKPTYEEIDEARLKQLDFERVMSTEEKVSEDGELTELKKFFQNGVTKEETDRIYELAVRVEDPSAREEVKIPEAFSVRVPKDTELESEVTLLKKARTSKGRGPLALFSLLAGLALGISAFFAGTKSTAFIPLAAVGILLCISSVVLLLTNNVKARKKVAESRASEFIISVSGENPKGDSLQTLLDMQTALAEYSTLLLKKKNSEEKKRESDEALREIYDYLAKFPAPTSKTLLGAISEIREKQRRLEALTLISERMTESLSEKKRAAIRDMQSVSMFLSRFKTLTDRPFDEIRDALGEFNATAKEIDEKRKELDKFARMNGIDSALRDKDEPSEAEIESGRKAAEEKIFALSREKVLLERRIESDRLETERKDSIIAAKVALEADGVRYEKNLDIIQKAKKYLTEAHENMTRRYLDKTKSSFEKYIRIIGGCTADFVLDTDFTLTKYEGAVARKSESYSKGTRELYSFALRLALTESLFDGDAPFIILDDPFMSFDDKTFDRARAVVKELSKSKQVIYFTCSRSRTI